MAPGKRVGLISQIPVYPAGYTVEDVLDTAFGAPAGHGGGDGAPGRPDGAGGGPRPAEAVRHPPPPREGAGGGTTPTTQGVQRPVHPQAMREQLFDRLSGGERPG